MSEEHIPDPTDRTIDTVHREITQVDEKLTTALDSREELSEIRHRATDEKFEIIENYRREREATAEAHRLELKSDEEAHRLELKQDSQKALEAALAAQKEANAKSETTFTKALEQVTETFNAAIASATTQINDLKLTVSGLSQYSMGGKDSHNESRLNLNTLANLVGMLLVYLGLHK